MKTRGYMPTEDELEALKYCKHVKAQIRKGKIPRYTFKTDDTAQAKLERVAKPDARYKGGVGPAKLTWTLKSSLHELTKK